MKKREISSHQVKENTRRGLPVPMVWSFSGPVLPVDVLPLFLSQSILSVVAWVKVHVSHSKSQLQIVGPGDFQLVKVGINIERKVPTNSFFRDFLGNLTLEKVDR